MLKCFEIYDGETHWYAAGSSYEAIELHKEEFDIDDVEDTEITEFPLDSELTVKYDDFCGGDIVTKTAGEWVEELGAGLICSTSYGYI